METLSYRIELRLIKMLNVVVVGIPVIFYVYVEGVIKTGTQNSKITLILLLLVFMLTYMSYGRIYDSFLISLVRISEMIYSQCLALIMSDIITYIVLCLVSNHLQKITKVMVMFLIQVILASCWCVLSHVWYFKKFPPKKTTIVYDNKDRIDDLVNGYGMHKKFDVQQIIDVDICMKEDFSLLKKSETVFLCGLHSHERNMVLKYCIKNNISVYVFPRIGDIIMSGAKRMHLFYMPLLRVERYNPTPEYLLIKRIFDMVFSFLALIIFSPIMLLTAISIKMSDGGPVFYCQNRLTINGKEFRMFKFRSMRQDAEKDGVPRLSTGKCDERITTVGRIIRKVRIDELPQLINVLKGQMSIVGPRPERPEIAKEYEKKLPEFSLRLQMKAGLTGYAQVYGKYNTTPYDKLQMDLMYIANPNFVEDLRIIFATIKILFMPESTEGVTNMTGQIIRDTSEENKSEI